MVKKHNILTKFIDLLKKIKKIADEDSFRGYALSIIIIIKFLILPAMGLVLGNTSYPIVSVVSNSMEHRLNEYDTICGTFVDRSQYESDFNGYWSVCGQYYENNLNISKEEFESFSMKNGFNIGDAMILYKKDVEDIKKGDIIVFMMTIYQDQNTIMQKPIIHRVVDINYRNEQYFFTTKGDWNPSSDYRETKIRYDQIEGVAVLKIPFAGYPKYFLSKLLGQL